MIFLSCVFGIFTVITSVNGLVSDCKSQPADILFLVDNSGSVGVDNFHKCLDFMNTFTDFFDIGESSVKISIYTFQGSTYGFNFNHGFDKTQLKDAISNVNNFDTGTAWDLETALVEARQTIFKVSNGARAHAYKIVVIITDGYVTLQQGADNLKRDTVVIFGMGTGSDIDEAEIKRMATSENHVYIVNSFDLINGLAASLRDKSCTELQRNPCDDRPCIHATGNGTDCVWINAGLYKCHCIAGYTGRNCDTDINECEGIVCQNGGMCVDQINNFTCNCTDLFGGRFCEIDLCKLRPADIVFVLDGSYSADVSNFNSQKEKVKEIVRKLRMASNESQIGIVTFSTASDIIMYLNRLDNVSKIEQAIDNITFSNGSSYLQKGLQNARLVMDSTQNGGGRYAGQDRLKKMVIVLYDGLTSDPVGTLSAADILKNEMVEIFAVATGNDFYHEHVLRLVSRRQNIFINRNNDDLYKRIVYDLSYPKCFDCKYTNETDMVFLVDCSTDMEEHDLRNTIPGLLRKIVSTFPIGSDGVRYALITFHSRPEVRFDLSKFSGNDNAAIKSMVSRYDKSTEKGNLTAGLLEVLEQFKSHGNYSDVRKKQLVIVSSFKSDVDNQAREILIEMKQNLSTEVIVFGLDCEKKRNIVNDIASSVAHTFYFGGRFIDSIEPLIANMQTTSCKRRP